jgi:hypothetical protein
MVVAGLDPDGMRTRGIAVIATNPDPATVDPFIVAADPDRSGIGRGPRTIDDCRRRGWRCAD